MPIKAELRALYPADWKAIRAEVLERAANCCERCGVENHAWISRAWSNAARYVVLAADVVRRWQVRKLWDRTIGRPPIRVVLTIAHLDQNPRNNGAPGHRKNLAALCQRCHLLHDREQHQQNAADTRRRKLEAKSGQLRLIETRSI